MEIIGKSTLMKLKKKNIGNKKLGAEIDRLIEELESFDPAGGEGIRELMELRRDADCVHNDGFYFFDINIHRTLILIELDEEGLASIVWAGTHQEYEAIFKNNKATIEKWLRQREYIK
ncbi:HigB_toxin, RelE-like toxic component of a toxin-antitoxin system [Sphingobacterium nematocida]|uniref:HigB_toxin, RelE-like toxic component of a toxin-antitoxin system n=1 Tax=Sphingobacterium nematocida TaxID=1513896 RepID=A0A1T5EJR9_9SPHI|nr:type II toxin-antitoxin system HigB family toxin [Sphingobacterium nematocida]SKB84292.1 HigB_toxin, RelE-like toxic component of a toxin-antitoxin system [Sphingobacterium nematocida]